MSTVKDLKKQFEKGTAPTKMVEKILPKDQGSYLYGGKTVEAQEKKTPLVVMAKPGNYSMVCDGDACYIKVPHNEGKAAITTTGSEGSVSGRRSSFGSTGSSRSSSRTSSRNSNR